ncbi:hypothetical protein BKA00_001859 [Actinomadura coerulea]|uniref:Uncharacterized protein n=1 Tax=Actinomadura coerulea TaxID=46159 RepID=A0A7X0FXJ7_9ACTN|nr:hypothetical protein [Actinomadura coerulea]
MNLRVTPPAPSKKRPFPYGKHIRSSPRPMLRKPLPMRGKRGR